MHSDDGTSDPLEVVRGQARLFDTERQAVIATTLDGRIVHWSRGAESTYGWKAEEVVDRFINEITPTAVSREQGDRIMALLQAGRSWSGSFEVRSKQGEEFFVSVRDIPVRDARGELIGIIGVSTRERSSAATSEAAG